MNTSSLDNSVLLQNSVQRGERILASDPEFKDRNPVEPGSLDFSKETRCIDILNRLCKTYSHRPALGFRTESSPYQILSYADLWKRVSQLASGWQHAGLVGKGDLVGICGFGSPDFVIAELACSYLGAVSVPLQTFMKAEDFQHIVKEAEIKCLVSSSEQLEGAMAAVKNCPSIKSLGVMDIGNSKAPAGSSSARVWTFQEIESLSDTQGLLPITKADGADPLVTLMYTSGSTGLPKGAMFKESAWIGLWKRTMFRQMAVLPQVTVGFMPLNHLMGRGTVISTLIQGGMVYFTLKSDMSSLFEDIRAVRPTTLSLVPRVADLIYQNYQMELAKLAAQNSGSVEDSKLQQQVMNEMRSRFLGDRLLSFLIGAAPTAPEVLNFLKQCFQVPVFNGYGSTEAGGAITFEDKITRENIEDYKLVAIPELGYQLTDKPYPRGELRIKPRQSTLGYLKNTAATGDLFDEQGYQRTGDIVEERALDHVVWIDRLKNILKLSHGEFVTLWRLESIFTSGSPFISQVFLYGNSARSYILAVLVPNEAAIGKYFSEKKKDASPEAVKSLLRMEVNRIGKDEKLLSYEVPKDFIVEPRHFTKENGLLTESNKLSRASLKRKYSEALESLYTDLEKNSFANFVQMQLNSGEAPLPEKILKSLQTILNIPLDEIEKQTDLSFKNLGGDSLGATNFSLLLKELSGVALPVGLILNPSSSIRSLIAFAEKSLAGGTSQVATFESVHGKNSDQIRLEDLTLNRFMTADQLKGLDTLKGSFAAHEVKTVFLTGANGFLGRFLTLEILKQLKHPESKLYCIVRAPDDKAARERLWEGFSHSESALKAEFKRLADQHLVVFAGDLMLPQFGLSPEVFEQMTQEVDSIVHNGALVNHSFSYEQLFEPNMLGTVEVIRLATQKKLKAIHFVSSIAAVDNQYPTDVALEKDDIRKQYTQRPNNAGYASGYATTKWAAEVLLHRLHDDYGVPVSVFRCGMILPHTQYAGEINVSDFFTRLLAGVVYTGVAPSSFYVQSPSGVKPHFDGLPVDFIAHVVAKRALSTESDYSTFHVINPQGNKETSFNEIVNWVHSDGYSVQYLNDYESWYQEFGKRLKALDPKKQQHSPLPILYQWEKPAHADEDTALDTASFRKLVEKDRKNGELPRISENFIHKCLDDLIALKIIDSPSSSAPSKSKAAPRSEHHQSHQKNLH